jgi:hypothetical protein
MIKKNFIWILVVICLVGFFVFRDKDEISLTFKCPEEMGTFEEYTENRAEVSALLLKESPNLSQEEIVTKVMELADKKGCTNEVDYLKDYGQSVSGKNAPLALVNPEQLERDDLIEYETVAGFSFKHTPETDVYPMMMDNYWEVVTNKKDENSKIIISISRNDEDLSAEEWFLGPNSGFDQTTEVFFRTEIDGQPAVYTDSGTWVVFNTPVDNHRVSVAELTVEDAEIMYEEMGIILGTLKFE